MSSDASTVGQAPEATSAEQPVSALPASEDVGADDAPKLAYHCRKCRTQLFTTAELAQHDAPSEKVRAKGLGRRSAPVPSVDGVQVADAAPSTTCSSLFLDSDAAPWVAAESVANVARTGDVTSAVVGDLDTIYCPGANGRCGAKLGGRSWIGAQCSCGAWVAPSFRIHASRVDAFPMA